MEILITYCPALLYYAQMKTPFLLCLWAIINKALFCICLIRFFFTIASDQTYPQYYNTRYTYVHPFLYLTYMTLLSLAVILHSGRDYNDPMGWSSAIISSKGGEDGQPRRKLALDTEYEAGPL